MKGIFVNENGGVPYAKAITQGIKPVETRNKNMLSALIGEQVAIVRTHRGKAPTVVGYATIYRATHETQKVMNSALMRKLTLIPEGSAYDAGAGGKWCYWLSHAYECKPYPLPSSVVRHGRSWCEWDDKLIDVFDVLRWSDGYAESMTDDEWKHLHDNDPRINKIELF